MYDFVEDKEFLKRAQNFCSKFMKKLEEELREKDINTQFFLVGSGARNMVTQNADEPIDFDYNLNIISVNGSNDIDDWQEKEIKHSVIVAANKIMKSFSLPDVDDSTSSITTNFKEPNKRGMSLDLFISMDSKDSGVICNIPSGFFRSFDL